MKRNTVSASALICLVTGLLITALPLIAGHYITISDVVKGSLTGCGLALEVIALVKINRSNKGRRCANRPVQL
jgi:hypothetical protein